MTVKIEINDKKMNKQADLWLYPRASRRASLLLSTLQNAFAGGGAVIGIVTIISSALSSILIGLVVGIIIFGFNTIYNTYHAHKEEYELNMALNEEFNKLKKLINEKIVQQLIIIKDHILLIKEQKDSYSNDKNSDNDKVAVREHRIKTLYRELNDLRMIVDFYRSRLLGIYFKAKEDHCFDIVNEKSKELKEIENTIKQIDSYIKDLANLPNNRELLSDKKEDKKKVISKPSRFKSILKDSGNIFTSFIGGAALFGGLSITICKLLGIAFSIGFLASTPIGWGILGAMVLGGVLAVGLNYVITGRRIKRVKQLNSALGKISSFIKTINHIDIYLNSIHRKGKNNFSNNQQNTKEEKRNNHHSTKDIVTELAEQDYQSSSSTTSIDETSSNSSVEKEIFPEETEEEKLSMENISPTPNKSANHTLFKSPNLEKDEPQNVARIDDNTSAPSSM